MSKALHRRTGFELELLAPRGSSRRTLAIALAHECGGQVRQVWHQDSEPTLVSGFGGRFLHLTQGFEVLDPSGAVLCTLVDDVTIVSDLDPAAPAPAGWHRILTDDPRLLRLLARVSDPDGTVGTALAGVAEIWGEPVEQLGSVWRVESEGATIALATTAGGERERPCEIVTPPLTEDHAAALERLLAPARGLGFTVPVEAAVHVHLDGAPFRDPAALANVVRLFAHWREPLRRLFGTNPNCRRLAPLPAELVEAVDGEPTTGELRKAAGRGGLTKFFDVNLTQLLRDNPIRDTIEVRILPGTADSDEAVTRAAMIEALLERCLEPERFPSPPTNLETATSALHRMATERV
ncbi:MAG TPA: amidoligase family protein [Mycobacteriales bacterium]|nr:amidoligase family protein [Mycobacteriales bacterium]